MATPKIATQRNVDAITNRLKKVRDQCWCFVSFEELRRWYGVQRIGTRLFRDIGKRWLEVQGDRDYGQLKQIKTTKGYYFLLGDWITELQP